MDTTAHRSGGRSSSIELDLGNAAFARGSRLTGVVVLRFSRPIHIRELTITLDASETARGSGLPRNLRGPIPFFHREVLLSGMAQPSFAAERMSLWWNAFLGRDRGRSIVPGEHIYPFSIPLPASLPPSYKGKAGVINYVVTAQVRFPVGRSAKTAREVCIGGGPRQAEDTRARLDFPGNQDTVHGSPLRIRLDLPTPVAETGGVLTGNIEVDNPQCADVGRIGIYLERRESAGSREESSVCWETTSTEEIYLEEKTPAAARPFRLPLPEDAPPSVEGTAVSVDYRLRIAVSDGAPLECTTPITVLRSIAED